MERKQAVFETCFFIVSHDFDHHQPKYWFVDFLMFFFCFFFLFLDFFSFFFLHDNDDQDNFFSCSAFFDFQFSFVFHRAAKPLKLYSKHAKCGQKILTRFFKSTVIYTVVIQFLKVHPCLYQITLTLKFTGQIYRYFLWLEIFTYQIYR